MQDIIAVSKREIFRSEVIQRVEEHRLTQLEASVQLGISERQVRRLVSNYRVSGVEGLVSKKRGAVSNRALPKSLVDCAITYIKTTYVDFGPTLAAEKLFENHNIDISVTTVRKIMMDHGLWVPRNQRPKRAYQPRNRRECRGELIQIDGPPHAWFEDRGPKCTLLVYIDDATSELMACHFVAAECTYAYFEITKQYLKLHGKPVAFYSDKHGVFRVNQKSVSNKGDGYTQFGRALSDLNIDIICANTPQAKGRVERMNKTLQDRLVKELRLQGISSMEEANLFLPGFIQKLNKQFAKAPLSSHDSHRVLHEHEDLDRIFTWQEDRTVSNNLTVQYDRVLYLIENTKKNLDLRRKRITVVDHPNGKIELVYKGVSVSYSEFDQTRTVDNMQGQVVENKRLNAVLSHVKQEQEKRERNRSISCPSRMHEGKLSTRSLNRRKELAP